MPWNGKFPADTASKEGLASISLNPEPRDGIGGIEICFGAEAGSESDFVGVDVVG